MTHAPAPRPRSRVNQVFVGMRSLWVVLCLSLTECFRNAVVHLAPRRDNISCVSGPISPRSPMEFRCPCRRPFVPRTVAPPGTRSCCTAALYRRSGTRVCVQNRWWAAAARAGRRRRRHRRRARRPSARPQSPSACGPGRTRAAPGISRWLELKLMGLFVLHHPSIASKCCTKDDV